MLSRSFLNAKSLNLNLRKSITCNISYNVVRRDIGQREMPVCMIRSNTRVKITRPTHVITINKPEAKANNETKNKSLIYLKPGLFLCIYYFCFTVIGNY